MKFARIIALSRASSAVLPWVRAVFATAAGAAVPFAIGCGRSTPSTGVVPAGTVSAAATSPAASPIAHAPVAPSAAPVLPPAPPRAEDAGGMGCLLIRGPIQLAMRGALALRLHGDILDAVTNDDGRPRVTSFAVTAAAAAALSMGPERTDESVTPALSVPCATAEQWTFCPDHSGAVHRIALDGSDDHVVASSRAGARVSAGMLGEHTALVYLASRTTSEGWMSEAWLAVDDAAPVRISEDGSGATAATVQARDSTLLVLTVDARVALTAMHVRTLSYEKQLQIGEDFVVFVGGPGERRSAPALAVSPGDVAWGLLPIGKDLEDFGLAVVRLDAPPHVDETVAWSIYPNGLDPAPVAAAAGTVRVERRGGSKIERRLWVARARPEAAAPASPRELELGTIEADASFRPIEIVATSSAIRDVALLDDGRGGLWIGWTDASGTWLERLACR